MSKRSKKLEEIRNMFKDIDINFDDINDNGISEFIKIIKLTKDERYQPNTKHLMSDIIMITFFAIISKATELGGSSNKEMLKLFTDIIGTKNPNSCKDKDKLTELLNRLEEGEI